MNLKKVTIVNPKMKIKKRKMLSIPPYLNGIAQMELYQILHQLEKNLLDIEV